MSSGEDWKAGQEFCGESLELVLAVSQTWRWVSGPEMLNTQPGYPRRLKNK